VASFAFQSMLYRTHREMLDAIAHEWLTAGGLNTPEIVAAITDSDAALAAECVEGWGLGQAPDAYGRDETLPSHMAEYGYDAADLAAAFGRIRNATQEG
jgi:hypothetical protein